MPKAAIRLEKANTCIVLSDGGKLTDVRVLLFGLEVFCAVAWRLMMLAGEVCTRGRC